MILASLGLFSCSGFLDEMDQDKFVPTEADHYASLLLGECNNKAYVFSSVQYMTDEVQESNGKIDPLSNRDNIKPLYTWQRNIEQTDAGLRVSNNTAWEKLYKEIAITNYVIEEIANANGTPAEIDYITGEARFIRAYCYFSLTNLYAEPYQDAAQAKVTYGVPLRTDIGTNQTYNKNMLDECYRLIETDLTEARQFIEHSGLIKSVYHPGVVACDLLMSRVKLYKKEYAEAIEEATKVIERTNLKKLTTGSVSTPFITKDNPELVYSFSQSNGGLKASDLKNACMMVNSKFLNLYDDDDLRKSLFFMAETDASAVVSIYSRKMEQAYTQLGYCNFRAAEAYLNRAEAYAFSNRLEEAKIDMMDLLSKRYANTDRIEIPSGQEELIRFIFNERLKEFCFEEYMRWFDLRRMGETRRPEIEHQYTLVDANYKKLGVETFQLLRNDRNYTLSVPAQERENNPMIRDYDRFDKLPDYKEEVLF